MKGAPLWRVVENESKSKLDPPFENAVKNGSDHYRLYTKPKLAQVDRMRPKGVMMELS
jgi:hypothetical protein